MRQLIIGFADGFIVVAWSCLRGRYGVCYSFKGRGQGEKSRKVGIVGVVSCSDFRVMARAMHPQNQYRNEELVNRIALAVAITTLILLLYALLATEL